MLRGMKLNHAVIIKIINSLGAQKTKLNSHRKITRKYKSRTIWHVMQLNWLSIYVMLQELNNHTKNRDWFKQVPHILSLFDSIWRRNKRQRCSLMSPLRKHLGIPVSVLQVSQIEWSSRGFNLLWRGRHQCFVPTGLNYINSEVPQRKLKIPVIYLLFPKKKRPIEITL